MSKPRPVIPAEYAGQWIAWDRDVTRILAHAPTSDECRALAPEGYLQYVRPLRPKPGPADAKTDSERELRLLTEICAHWISEADRQRLLTLWRDILGIKRTKTRTLREVRDDAGCPVMEPDAEAAFSEAMRRHDALNEAMRRDWAEHVD